MALVALPLLTANSYMGLYYEGTYGGITGGSVGAWVPNYGTAASPTWGTGNALFMPITSPKVTPGVKWLDDSDFRGSPVMHYDQIQGVFMAEYSGKTFTYTDVYPHMLRGALGSTDSWAALANPKNSASVAVSGTGGAFTGYTHTLGLVNTPNIGSQPPSYTIYNDSVDATYQMAASRIDTLSVSFAADAAVENTFTYKTNQPTAAASVPTGGISAIPGDESTQHLIPAWNCSASIGGSAVSVVESMSLDIKRGTNQIYALGSQSAVSNYAGPIEVTGKFTLIVQQGETYWANALVRDQQQMLFALQDPYTGFSVTYQMSAVQLESPVIVQSRNYVELEADFIAVANTTDNVNAGYSPLQVTVVNGITYAY